MQFYRIFILLALIPFTHGDIIDWVNIQYVCRQAKTPDRNTQAAQSAIVSLAHSTAARGPWTVTSKPNGVLPPSKDVHDYLSWAPYHWPECNWCPANRNRALGELAQRRMTRQRRRSDAQAQFSPTTTLPSQLQEAAQGKAPACRPSPTKTMAPSATWTTCPYQVQDGKVNPDVRTLNDSSSMVAFSQSIFYNAHCFAIRGNSACSRTAASLLDTYLLAPATRMNPNVNFGQIVRGPGPQEGAFTGVLDLRGCVNVVNAIQILKNAGSPDWTAVRDAAMTDWMGQYASWLKSSDIGKAVAGKVNNHVTFYAVQFAAVQLASGDPASAASTLKSYFQDKFPEQIAKSGEQPFEAVRTRPYHYRCFHLEAMIAAAKLGDWLGLDFWTVKSKYGATIQDAVDFTMRVDPKTEDPMEIVPHVVAVAAAYGDPKGKYATFLKQLDRSSSYQSQPVWFFNQVGAFGQAPSSKGRKAGNTRDADDDTPFTCNPTDLIPGMQEYGFELEPGLYCTCGMVAPYFALGRLSDVDNQ
ncbi:alginate lyase-domain-containing protein [Mycena amicta]|nr:alginate lyase-domain-containing protein [Mycena amicta]